MRLLSVMLLSLTSVTASAEGTFSIQERIFEYGSEVPVHLSVRGAGEYVIVHARERFDRTDARFGTPTSAKLHVPITEVPQSETQSIQTTALRWVGGELSDVSRAYYDLLLIENDERATANHRIFVYRPIAGIDPSLVNWSFANGATILPTDPIEVTLNGPVSIADDITAPRIEVLKLGRYLPGGAVQPDHIVAHSGPYGDPYAALRLRDMRPRYSHASLGLEESLTVTRDGDDSSPNGTKLIEWFARRVPNAPPRPVALSRLANTPGGSLHDANYREIYGPLAIGPHIARVIGPAGAILAERRFDVAWPEMDRAITFEPEQVGPYQTPPTVVIDFPEALQGLDPASEFSLFVSRIAPGGVHDFGVFGDTANIHSAHRDGNRLTMEQAGDWVPGRYAITLFNAAQSIILAQKFFEIAGDRDPGYYPLSPELDPGDVVIQLTSEQAQAVGPDISFLVFGPDGKPLETGPLIAELFMPDQFTYGCARRAGHYIGQAGIVSTDGTGSVAAPSEPGKYELRISRPMSNSPNSSETHNHDALLAANRGDVFGPTGMETIGSVTFEVTAPSAPEMISIEPNDPTALDAPISLRLNNPGAAFRGHIFEVQIWRAAGRLVGGLPTVALTGTSQDWRYWFANDFRGNPVARVTRLPRTISIGPFYTPGNYELRVLDVTTGFFIDKATIRLRDPGPPALPAFAQYDENRDSDWPRASDRLRGVEAWQPPRADCIDPPDGITAKLAVVDYVPNDPDTLEDDEYVSAQQIWPGYPYVIQATFNQAPPDHSYRLRVDGERRIRVYRSDDDPKIFRSDLITFDPSDSNEVGDP